MTDLLPPYHKPMTSQLDCDLANDRIAALEAELAVAEALAAERTEQRNVALSRLAAAEERLRVCVDDDGRNYKMLRLAAEDVVSVANRGSAEAQRCDTCAHCAECDIQQMLSPFIEDWGDTFCSSWTDRKQEP